MSNINIVLLDSPSKQYMQEQATDAELYQRILSDLEASQDYFLEKFDRAEENNRFYKTQQWTEAEEEEFRNSYRLPYQINEVAKIIQHMVGTQTQTRLDSKVVGRERADEPLAEFLTSLIKWVEQVNDLEYTETNIFRDGLIKAAGAVVVRWMNRDMQYGYPSIEKVPIHELMWDLTASNLDLSDARWMSRVMMLPQADATEMYPEFAEHIKKSQVLDSEHDTIKIFKTKRHRDYTVNRWRREEYGRRFVRVIEHYERAITYTYIVADDVQGYTRDFDSDEESKAFYDELIRQYSEGLIELQYPDGTDKVTRSKVGKNTIIQTLMIGTEVVSREVTGLPRFPYVVNFCHFDDGDYWAFADYLIHPQKLVNRFFAQWDYQLGTATKNLVTVMKSMLPRNVKMADVEDVLSRTSPVLEVLNHEALRTHPNQQVQPELFQGIGLMREFMMNFAGGRNVLGLQENAAESGRAVMARAEQGGVAKLPFYDNLRFFRKQTIELVLWYVRNFMPSQQIQRIIGNASEVQPQPLDIGIIDTLREFEYDIQVSETPKSDSVKERQFEQLTQLFGQIGAPVEIISEFLIEFSNLPATVKERLMSKMDWIQKYKQEQAQMAAQQQMQQGVQQQVEKKGLRQQLEAQMGVQPGQGAPEGNANQSGGNSKVPLDSAQQQMIARAQGAGQGQINQMMNSINSPEEIQKLLQLQVQGGLGVNPQ